MLPSIALLALLLLLALPPARLHGQSSTPRITEGCTLRGRVLSGKGEPLVGASVYIDSLKLGVISDGEGDYQLGPLPEGEHWVTFSYLGFRSLRRHLSVAHGRREISLDVHLEEEAISVHEVVVSAKSEARKIREQAMPVSVISMQQLQGTVSDVQNVLSRTVGVTVRATGGVGSSSRLSVRGLEGKRVGIFIDEAPMSDQSDFLGLNDIPIDMIERIEIFKGVVPAKFGASSMGGAVNLVIKEYPERYADASYSYESFNTHKGQLVLKRNLSRLGLTFGVGGSYIYSDNSYTMESPYTPGLKIKREHDQYRKLMVGGSFKAKKWWFDKVEFEPVYINTHRQIQGVEWDIRSARVASQVYIMANKLEKKDFIIPGLDFTMSTGLALTHYSLVDTGRWIYAWDGQRYPTVTNQGGELGTQHGSLSSNRKLTLMHKLNLEYLLHAQHTLNFNSMFTLLRGHPSDPVKRQSLGKETLFPSTMQSWVVGVSYDARDPEDRFLNSLTVRYYLYSMRTMTQNIFVPSPPDPVSILKQAVGFSDAMRYRLLPTLSLKLSGGYDVRTPAENELLGDGISITPSEQLLPERNASLNLGMLYDLGGLHPTHLQVELSGFFMYLTNSIHFMKGFLGAQYQNFGSMRTLGAELEVKIDATSFLFCYGNVTFQDLRDARKTQLNSPLPNITEGKRIPNVPYLMANGGLELHWENPFGGQGQNIRLYSDLAYVHEYYFDFEITSLQKRRIPTSLTVDAGLEYSFFHQRLILSAMVKNATNARLLSEFNRPLPGRSFGGKIRYIFK